MKIKQYKIICENKTKTMANLNFGMKCLSELMTGCLVKKNHKLWKLNVT